MCVCIESLNPMFRLLPLIAASISAFPVLDRASTNLDLPKHFDFRQVASKPSFPSTNSICGGYKCVCDKYGCTQLIQDRETSSDSRALKYTDPEETIRNISNQDVKKK